MTGDPGQRIAEYRALLERKRHQAQPAGRDVEPGDVNPLLHPWQQRIVRRKVRIGRGALWSDTGTGKTWMQLEFARLAGRRSLVTAPLAVCHQTVREAAKLGIETLYARSDNLRELDEELRQDTLFSLEHSA